MHYHIAKVLLLPFTAAWAIPAYRAIGLQGRGLPAPVPYQISPEVYQPPPQPSTSSELKVYPTSVSPIWSSVQASSQASPTIYPPPTSSWISVPVYSSQADVTTVVITLTRTEILTLEPSETVTSGLPSYYMTSAIESKVYDTSSAPPSYLTASPVVYSYMSPTSSIPVYSYSSANSSIPFYESTVAPYSSSESVIPYSTPAVYSSVMTSASIPVYASSIATRSAIPTYPAIVNTTIPSSTCFDQPASTTHYTISVPWAPYITEICHTYPPVTCTPPTPTPYSSFAPIYSIPTIESKSPPPTYDPPTSTTPPTYPTPLTSLSPIHLTTITDHFPTQLPIPTPLTTTPPTDPSTALPTFSIISVIPLPPSLTSSTPLSISYPISSTSQAATTTPITPAYTDPAQPPRYRPAPTRGGPRAPWRWWGEPRWGWGWTRR